MTRPTASELRTTSATSSAADRRAPASMSRAPLLETAGVLVAQLTVGRALEAPHHAVAVAGEVREHVPDAPAGQQARSARHLVGEPRQVVGQGPLRGQAAGDPAGGAPGAGVVLTRWAARTGRRACRPSRPG